MRCPRFHEVLQMDEVFWADEVFRIEEILAFKHLHPAGSSVCVHSIAYADRRIGCAQDVRFMAGRIHPRIHNRGRCLLTACDVLARASVRNTICFHHIKG